MCQITSGDQYNFADGDTEKILGNEDGSFSAAYTSKDNSLVK